MEGCVGPLERLPRELVGMSLLRATQNGCLDLRDVSHFFSEGIFTQCFSPNLGLLVTVQRMGHLIKTSFSIYISEFLNSRLSHRFIMGVPGRRISAARRGGGADAPVAPLLPTGLTAQNKGFSYLENV